MDVVVARQIARIVHGQLLAEEVFLQLDPPGVEQLIDILRGMNHLEVSAQIGILVLDRVEAMGALRDDPLA